MSFEYVYTPSKMESGLFDIWDVKDYPVLYTAIIEDMAPAEFMERFL